MAGIVHEVENADLLARVRQESANAARQLAEAARLHRGQIVVVGSIAGFGPLPTSAAYGASKAALTHLLGARHRELIGLSPHRLAAPFQTGLQDGDFRGKHLVRVSSA